MLPEMVISTTALGSLFQCQPVPLPMLDHSFTDEIFPNIQPEPPLMQLEAICSRPGGGYLGEDTDPTSPQALFREL